MLIHLNSKEILNLSGILDIEEILWQSSIRGSTVSIRENLETYTC